MERWIMHVDMDAFFAAVEQRENEDLKNKPVIVGGLGMRGVVSTASYEARAYGVHSAMPMVLARKKCPQGIFLPVRHALYQQVSKEIFAIFALFSPCVEPLSIDEAFLDISGMEKLYKGKKELALELKEKIYQKTRLIASVGIAPNKFLAKLASDLQKPDGLVMIGQGEEAEVIKNLPLRRLWGVGSKTEEKLVKLGFSRIGDIAAADFSLLRQHFGQQMARHLYELSHGRDTRAVEPENVRQSIGQEITFEEDLREPAQMKKIFLQLAEKVGFRLRQNSQKAKTIQIKVRTASFQTFTRSQTLPEATDFDQDLYAIAWDLYQKLHLTENVRLLGITAAHFVEEFQASLFEAPGKEKKERLYQTLDQLKLRFGESVITKAQLITAAEKAAETKEKEPTRR